MRHFLRLLPVLIITSARAWASGDAATSTNTTINFVNRTPLAGAPAKGLHFAPDPPNAGQVIAAAMHRLQSTNFRGANVPAVDVDPPLANYSIRDMGPLLAGGSLDTVAKLGNYSYDVEVGGKLLVIVDAMVDATTGAVRLGATHLTPTLLIENGVKEVSALGPVQAGSFEVRRLDFFLPGSGARHYVLWLKSSPGGVDLIYPILAYPEQYSRVNLQKGTLYKVADFVAHLQAAKAATPYEVNTRKAANGEDTTTTRLTALQTALDAALGDLKKQSAGSFEQTMADITRAQTEVAQGLACVKAHPEVDRLALQDAKYSVPRSWRPSEFGFGDRFIVNNPDLKLADDLSNDLMDLVGNLAVGRPIIGEIGGSRDAILRDVGMAACDYIMAMRPRSSLVPGTLPLSAIPADNSSSLGSITGMVEVRFPPNPNGPTAAPFPAAYVFITLIGMDPHLSARDGQLISGEIPVTLSDETGIFTIRNLPPGFYSVNASGGRVVVEVKAGAETKIAEPLLAPILNFGAGG